MVTFIKHCCIRYHCFHIEKKHIEDSVQASAQLSLLISRFIREHYSCRTVKQVTIYSGRAYSAIPDRSPSFVRPSSWNTRRIRTRYPVCVSSLIISSQGE